MARWAAILQHGITCSFNTFPDLKSWLLDTASLNTPSCTWYTTPSSLRPEVVDVANRSPFLGLVAERSSKLINVPTCSSVATDITFKLWALSALLFLLALAASSLSAEMCVLTKRSSIFAASLSSVSC